MSVESNGQVVVPPICEIVNVPMCVIGTQKVAGNPQALILTFTLPNGRQYQFPLDAGGRRSLLNLVGGLQVFGPGDLPDS